MSLLVSFTKMHGLGNDFVVINAVDKPCPLTTTQIQFISNRHRGIGCDQILMIEPSPAPDIDFFYRIYNADGSEAGQCGNGARCIAKYIKDKKLSTKKTLHVQTLTSKLVLYLEEEAIRVNMGIPKHIAAYSLPVAIDSNNKNSFPQTGTSLTLGNPHIVFITQTLDNLFTPTQELQDFNVSYMKIIDRHYIQLRVFERGAGETQACGSGACAAAVVGITQGLLDTHIIVEQQGGKLNITWQGKNTPVWMSGHAETVFEGIIDLLV